MNVVHTEIMKAWEARTIEGGVPAAALMEEAVAGCARQILEQVEPMPVLVFAGRGNNGNDAIAVGLELARQGWSVETLLAHSAQERTQHPMRGLAEYASHLRVWSPDMILKLERGGPRLVVDGLLGLGSSGPVRPGPVREILRYLRESRRAGDVHVALDVPSGLDPDTGAASEDAFVADLTLALGAVKAGCLMDRARSHVGRIVTVPLPFQSLDADQTAGHFFERTDARALVKPLPPDAHKHSRGRVSIWAGSREMPGAAILACSAALRSGAGYVRFMGHRRVIRQVLAECPEVVAIEWEPGEKVPADFFDSQALVVGPGLGREEELGERIEDVLDGCGLPVVLDADALFHLHTRPSLLGKLTSQMILTPHSGEMKRLIGSDFSERRVVCTRWTSDYPGLLVLKGPNSLVATAGQRISWNGSGNGGLATAGSGDVLSGLLGGLAAQGYRVWDAARLGVYLHGLAGDLLAMVQPAHTIRATDLVDALCDAWGSLNSCGE